MSGLATSKYDVSLNGQGYLLVEESYKERSQQAFAPRFSTGDPGYGDLSFWQFLAETSFDSCGQEKFSDTGKFHHSSGWDTRSGKAYLGFGPEEVTKAASFPTAQSAGTTYLIDNFLSDPYSSGLWGGFPQTDLTSGPWGYSQAMTVADDYMHGIVWAYDADDGTQFTLSAAQAIAAAMAVRAETAAYGEWEIIVRTVVAGGTQIGTDVQANFIDNGTDSYNLKVVGDTYTLCKNATVLITFTRAAAAEDVTIKITRSAAGLFEIFSNGVSKGTATDNTVTTCTRMLLGAGSLYDSSYYTSYTVYAGGFTSIKGPSLSSHNAGATSVCILYDNKIFICYESTAAAFTWTTIVAADVSTNQPEIVHINARSLCIWSRDGSPTAGKNQYLVASFGASIKVYNSTTLVDTIAVTPYISCLVPLDGTRLVAAGTVAEQDGKPALTLITMAAGTWTESLKEIVFDGGVEGSVCSSAAFDSNGVLYLCTNNMGANPLSTPSRLLAFTTTDLGATNIRMSAQYTLSGFMARGLFAVAGDIYLHGAYVENGISRAGIMKFPGTVSYKSPLEVDVLSSLADRYNHGVPGVWQNSNGVVFMGETPDEEWEPVLELLPSGNIRNCAAFNTGRRDTQSPNITALAEYSGRYYMMSMLDNKVFRTGMTRGNYPSTFANTKLTMSSMGGNTSRITKTLYSVLIGLTEALPAGETLTVKVNGTTVGTITSASGANPEIVLTVELTAADFVITLHAPYSMVWAGGVTEVAAKYIPTQFKKKMWGFGVRATKALKLIDGKKETATSTTLFAAIKTAWESNVPVTFIDIDGVSHTVIVTEYDRRVPLIDRRGGTNIEQLCFVELLEV